MEKEGTYNHWALCREKWIKHCLKYFAAFDEAIMNASGLTVKNLLLKQFSIPSFAMKICLTNGKHPFLK